MTDVREAVRAACALDAHVDGGCQWPGCNCHMTKGLLATLLSTARVRERERCERIVRKMAVELWDKAGSAVGRGPRTEASLTAAAAAVERAAAAIHALPDVEPGA